MILGGLFDFDSKKDRLKGLLEKINDVHFWESVDTANQITKEANLLKKLISHISLITDKITGNLEIARSIDDDLEFLELLEVELKEIKLEVENLKIETYLSSEFDYNNCILEIHSGAGGTEACDWASMLYRMYSRYLEKHEYKVEVLDRQDGEEVGIKSIMVRVIGEAAYGYLKGERGVHRLVRISPFDSNKRRHTSFASVEITPEVAKEIEIEILPKDIKIDIFRSSGPGGQGVNTTDSAVRITHLPTGIVVTCQNERSQIQNREHCMEVLKAKLYAMELEKQNESLGEYRQGQKQIAFGSGKRSYVMCPYTLVKDHESGCETANVLKVLDGDLDLFIKMGLRK